MAIRLVIFDCDRTLWEHHDVAETKPPYRRVDEDTVEDARGDRVRLFPGAREVLDALLQRGLLISIASWNLPQIVSRIFDALGLTAYFTRPKVEFHPHKDRMIASLLRELAEDGIVLRPEEVLFVDDRLVMLETVRAAVGPIRTLQAGVDIADLKEVLGHLH